MKESIIIGTVLFILLMSGIFKSFTIKEEDKKENRITEKTDLTFNFKELEKK